MGLFKQSTIGKCLTSMNTVTRYGTAFNACRALSHSEFPRSPSEQIRLSWLALRHAAGSAVTPPPAPVSLVATAQQVQPAGSNTYKVPQLANKLAYLLLNGINSMMTQSFLSLTTNLHLQGGTHEQAT